MQHNKGYSEMIKPHSGLKGMFNLFQTCLSRFLQVSYVFIVKHCLPINHNIVVFRSNPDYSDNARALAEYMVKNGYAKKYKIYFDVDNLSEYCCRYDGISFISIQNSTGIKRLKNLKVIYTAGYLMSTHKAILSKRKSRKNQKLINLWHGCSFKDKTGRDGNGTKFFDVALVPGEMFVKTKAYFWNVDEHSILPLGYPRYDWLKEKDRSAQLLFDSFKNVQDSKIVMWMPTFRTDKRGKCNESNIITKFPLIEDSTKWKEIDTLCIRLNIVLLIKLHPFQPEYGIPYEEFKNIKKIDNQLFDRVDVPMYKFVALTDALVTDYSSIAVDYLIVDRPIAFTLDDYEDYRNTRGFVFDDPRIYMPGHHLYKFEDLKEFLKDLSEGNDLHKKDREKMYGEAICQSENYCKNILNALNIK